MVLVYHCVTAPPIPGDIAIGRVRVVDVVAQAGPRSVLAGRQDRRYWPHSYGGALGWCYQRPPVACELLQKTLTACPALGSQQTDVSQGTRNQNVGQLEHRQLIPSKMDLRCHA
ncbi:hypothetical protein FHT03_000463 [Xanthomonas arboricola]|uniref:hypothetical protein n=1 Tax=Xanthomonas cannabis TaxID=1885674 RepID=UPI0016166B6B|nr:hypothetical protein [Xanthomonas cannabis]MBB3804534.1 hypothetical protein [Xanthomonas cannabis]